MSRVPADRTKSIKDVAAYKVEKHSPVCTFAAPMSKEDRYVPFAVRYGFEPQNSPIQIDSIDGNARTDLYNLFYMHLFDEWANAKYGHSPLEYLHEELWMNFFRCPIDDFPNHEFEYSDLVKKFIQTELWYKVYQFFEHIIHFLDEHNSLDPEYFIDGLNALLSKNSIGYRVVNKLFVPVTNEEELAEIGRLQAQTGKGNLSGVGTHLKTAIALLSKRPEPDFRNSIKESISMVESVCRLIQPGENTLGKALDSLEKHQKIHSTLKQGFEKLYAFSNGKGGIRHALMDDSKLDMATARFFLISCSAFANYLIEKAAEEKLL